MFLPLATAASHRACGVRPTTPRAALPAVEQDLSGLHLPQHDGIRHIGPPEGRAGERVVAGLETIGPDLRTHLQLFSKPDDDGLVFVGPAGRPLRASGFSTCL